MTTLTDSEQAVVNLRKQGRSWNEIATHVGSTKSAVNSSYRRAQSKLGKADPRSLEARDAEGAAVVIDAVSDPFASISQAARKCGFPPSTVQRLVQRLRSQYAPLNTAMVEFKTHELIGKLKNVQMALVDHMDPLAMAGASLKELAISLGVVTDKIELIEGRQQTHVMTHEERRSMDETAKRLWAEMKRRGLTPTIVEGEVVNDQDGG